MVAQTLFKGKQDDTQGNIINLLFLRLFLVNQKVWEKLDWLKQNSDCSLYFMAACVCAASLDCKVGYDYDIWTL